MFFSIIILNAGCRKTVFAIPIHSPFSYNLNGAKLSEFNIGKLFISFNKIFCYSDNPLLPKTSIIHGRNPNVMFA